MRFLVLVPATADDEAGIMPPPAWIDAMTAYNEALAAAGVLVDGDGLLPSAEGARIRFDGASRTVTDGPFTEAKELVGGFWVWECSSRAEAIEWLERAPFDGGVELELRPMAAFDDYATVDDGGAAATV